MAAVRFPPRAPCCNTMKSIGIVYVLALVCLGVAVTAQSNTQYEEEFLTVPSASGAFEHLTFYTSMPHVAGTKEDHDTAIYTRDMMRSYGLDSEIEEVEVLLSYPKSRSLRITEPAELQFEAVMQEAVEPIDPTSGDPRVIPTFNGYAPSGDVTGDVVYVNYGRIEDFEVLVQMGVELEGTIAFARYGAVFRGIKAMLAQQFGCAGLVIYSDPADDGYAQGTVFPEGPWRSNSSVQRGSVQFLSICPGDPRDPSCGYDPDTYNYTQSIPSIPVQPISYSDAYPFLSALSGNAIPDSSWQGALNFTYMVGPGPVVANLHLEIDFTVTPIWNVITKIPGEGPNKDEVVIVGNHRDAWTFGGVDPNSGTASMLEMARGFGQVIASGWKPQRSIEICSWDGEEYGLLGSTAYARNNAERLQKHAIAYFNVDTAVSGTSFGASATPSLADLISSVSEQITDPNTAFLDHLGIPCSDMSFDGDYGVYHSVYDDLYWSQQFGDPTFQYHATLAQLWGLMTMKVVDSEILPFNYTRYAEDLSSYLESTIELAEEFDVPFNSTDLSNAVNVFHHAANTVASEIEKVLMGEPMPSDLNERLMMTERRFLSKIGLPKRPFYKHVIQAPGLYQGYNPDTFPGVKQSIRSRHELGVDLEQREAAIRIADAARYLCKGCVS